MKAAPRPGCRLKQLRAARATMSFERASTCQVYQDFMMKIKKAKLTQKDVKNEGCSQDLMENKGQKYTNYH